MSADGGPAAFSGSARPDGAGAREQPAAARFHDMDLLRVFVMFLAVVLHATVFMVPSPCWPVQLDYAEAVEIGANPYGYLLMAIHGFRMPAFFVLVGFVTALLWQRRGGGGTGLHALGRHRLKRVGLPLLACMVTVLPLTHWLVGLSAAGTGKALAAHCDAITWAPLAWMGGLYHMWFLWYLLLMTAAFAAAAALGLRFRNALWWLLVPLTLAPQYFMRQGFGADSAVENLLPDPFVFTYYSIFFLFGVFVYQRGVRIRRWWTVAALPAAVAFLPGLALAYPEAMGLDPDAPWVDSAAAAFQTAFSWAMCFALMGLFRWIVPRERFWMRWVSDASYWIYIAHLPLLVAAQWLVADWAMSAHLKFLLVCLGVYALLLLTYPCCVRYTAIGTMLNGRRHRIRPETAAGPLPSARP